jgi:hypothetical protein
MLMEDILTGSLVFFVALAFVGFCWWHTFSMTILNGSGGENPNTLRDE